jgi:hypothetical protein
MLKTVSGMMAQTINPRKNNAFIRKARPMVFVLIADYLLNAC